MGLEVLVRDKAITIGVESLEDLEGTRLTRAESYIFDLGQQTTETTSSGLVSDVT